MPDAEHMLDLAYADLDKAREENAALRAERDALAKRVAALEIAVVRACVPLEAFWADEGSRRYVAPSLRPLFEDAIAIGRAAIADPRREGVREDQAC